MKNFYIDIRKSFDSGIGRYIRNILPQVLSELGDDYRIYLIINDKQKDYTFLSGCNFTFIEIAEQPFSFFEQFRFCSIIVPGSFFWATSLSHPIFCNVNLISTIHDVAQIALPGSNKFSVKKYIFKFFLSNLRRKSKLIFFNSFFTSNEFSKYIGRPISRSVITPLGVDSFWFNELNQFPIKSDKPYFIYVGNIRPHKNLVTLIEAFKAVACKIAHDLIIVGECSSPRFVNSHCNLSLSSFGQIKYYGVVDDLILKNLVSHAKAMVIPSLYEGFGLPALEAMASGCPVILSNNTVFPEICSTAASYFDPTNIKELSLLLIKFSTLSFLERKKLSDAGSAQAMKYNWKDTARLTSLEIKNL